MKFKAISISTLYSLPVAWTTWRRAGFKSSSGAKPKSGPNMNSPGETDPPNQNSPGDTRSHRAANGTPATHTQISRHDHHNIEIKSVIELGQKSQRVTTELFLFFPKSFEIGLVGKADLVKDLRTRLRLAIPADEGFDDEDFRTALTELRKANARLDAEAMAQLEMGQEVPADLRESVLEAAKDIAAIIAERLKRLSVEHGRQFFLSQSLLSTASSRAHGFETFVKNLQLVHRKIEMIREAMRSRSDDGRSLNALLDEYMSQLYVQYLGAIGNEFGRHESEGTSTPSGAGDESPTATAERTQELAGGSTVDATAGFEMALGRARHFLQALQEDEAVYRKTRGLSFETETDLEREKHLIRLSQLKKFFQSKTFVEVVKNQAEKKVTETTALIGTAMAGIFAAVLEQFGRKNVATVASQGLILVSLGVILYVLRDRMKDWARVKLQEKAMGLVPDFETQLAANQRRFGMSREWVRILSSKTCDTVIMDARHADSVVERNLRLPEDVLWARRIFFLEPCGGAPGQPRALHENLRLNLDRHLKFMDDPFKDLTDLEAGGRLTLSRSHRVYHFHMVTRTTILDGPDAEYSMMQSWGSVFKSIFHMKAKVIAPRSVQLSAHRIVLDKSGILRVEVISL